MTDNEQPETRETAQPPQASQKAHQRGARPAHRRRWGLWLLALLLLGLPLAAGYGAWWLWQDIEEQRAQLADLDHRLSDQQRTQERQSRSLEQLPDRLKDELADAQRRTQREQAERIEGLEQRTNRLESRLRSLAGTDREDWKLAEAEYLLRLANQRLVLERDTRNALALAQSTDELLSELGDPDLLPVRRALSEDIQALKLADRVDREGLYLELEALSGQIGELPLVEPMRAPDAEADTEPATDAPSGLWPRVKQSFNRLTERLSDHIRIRRHEEPVQALIDPREAFILRQRLGLMLEQAQAALLREDARLYRTSLERAADWLETHYVLNPRTETALDSLRELAEKDIAPDLPDLNDALNRLKNHVERQNRLSPDFQRAPDEEPEA